MSTEMIEARVSSSRRPVDTGLREIIPIFLAREKVDGVDRYEMSCDKGAIEVPNARHFVEDHLADFLPDVADLEFTWSILLAFGEAAANALNYRVDGQCPCPFIACGVLGDRFIAVIANSCRDYFRRPAKPDCERGRGLNIIFATVEEYCDRMSLTQIVPEDGGAGHFVLAFTVYRQSLC